MSNVMVSSRPELERCLIEELSQPSIEQAHRLSDEIRRRHGETVVAVVFYGSCLRKRDARGGVLDFYVLVDDYREAYASRLMALANAWLPPNVFLLILGEGEDALRAKYAVMTTEDFLQASFPVSTHSIVWSRFCQPARVVWARDEESRRAVAAAATEAVLTMVRASLALIEPEDSGQRRFTSESLWQTGFGGTYGTELRPEGDDTIRQLFDADPDRYANVTRLALEVLVADGDLVALETTEPGEPRDHGTSGYRATMRSDVEASMKQGWQRRAGPIKILYAVRLIKSAFTFGDWLPYALWKLNRHTGVQIEPTPLPRRHPLHLGWPVIFKLLLSRKLR
jgi:hypothetical protein